MQKRYIGPVNPDPDAGVEDAGVEVLVAGHKVGNVKHGGVIDVPDELAGQVAWPESLWEDVKAAAPTKKKGDS